MKKKLAQARQPKVRKPKARQPEPAKARPAAAAALLSGEPAAPPHPPLSPEPCGDDGTLSIEAMLRAQLAATHVAAMDCLRRAGTAESAEVRDQALTHATRLLSLFTRQVKTLEQGRWYTPAVARGARPAREPATPEIVAPDIAAAAEAAMGADGPAADTVEKTPADAMEQTPADDRAGLAAFAPGGGPTPAPPQATARGGP